MKHSEKTILVLGSTGKTGRRVMDGLKARGLSARGASRSSELLFDWNDPATWTPVLTEVEAVYVVYSLDPTAPVAADTIRSFAEQAANAGVKNLVFLSGRGDEAAQP
ncbi:MAG TPA: NmrA family transcriptional regulator, partial [Acidobacteriota bacterium]|nr:NmrA family transcriptional regulator [Acidobacteriota bacterium]